MARRETCWRARGWAVYEYDALNRLSDIRSDPGAWKKMGMGYHIQDEAGSTLFILDRERNIRKSYRYDAFGRVLEERGNIENRLTFTGQMYDGGTD